VLAYLARYTHRVAIGYFIASVTHRRTLPVPQPHCAMASERWCYAARPAELTSFPPVFLFAALGHKMLIAVGCKIRPPVG
jgi:hypothetical protein